MEKVFWIVAAWHHNFKCVCFVRIFHLYSYPFLWLFSFVGAGSAEPSEKGTMDTAGLAGNCRLGLRHGLGCRCPISIPRPVTKTRQKTTYRTLDIFLKK